MFLILWYFASLWYTNAFIIDFVWQNYCIWNNRIPIFHCHGTVSVHVIFHIQIFLCWKFINLLNFRLKSMHFSFSTLLCYLSLSFISLYNSIFSLCEQYLLWTKLIEPQLCVSFAVFYFSVIDKFYYILQYSFTLLWYCF